MIVGSSPCQEFSYRAMPWKKAKALPPPYLGMELFNHQFRIQREASEAAGHHIPMVVENVRGAQKWVGRAPAHYGSFYLWGDVGMVGKRIVAGPLRFGMGINPNRETKLPLAVNGSIRQGHSPARWTNPAEHCSCPTECDCEDYGHGLVSEECPEHNHRARPSLTCPLHGEHVPSSIKNGGRGSWFAIGSPGQTTLKGNPDGRKKHGSKSKGRKMASAMIAKIPYPLAVHVARSFKSPA